MLIPYHLTAGSYGISMLFKLLCFEEDGFFVGVPKFEHKQIKLSMHGKIIDFIQRYPFLVIILQYISLIRFVNRFFAIKNR